jgi:hypothetical protein
VNKRRSGFGRIVLATAAPWLIRWMLLQDRQHKFGLPGEGEQTWIHVVCPEPGCMNERWITKYEPGTAKRCGQHDGPLVRMVPCPMCQRKPGFHPNPGGMW